LTRDRQQACQVLRSWSDRAGAQDRGALLWDAIWTRLQQIPTAEFHTKAFSVKVPLQTPAGVNTADPRVAVALNGAFAGAIEDLRRKGLALDTPLGTLRFARSEGHRVQLFGGCDAEGYFTVACANEGDYTLGDQSHGNTYLQIVYFDKQGVVARTLLAHGQRETAVSNGDGMAPVARYAKRHWLRFPFREHDIARHLLLQREIRLP